MILLSTSTVAAGPMPPSKPSVRAERAGAFTATCLFAQRRFVHLADWQARQFIDEVEAFGDFVIGKMLPQELTQGVVFNRCVSHKERHGSITVEPIRNTHYARLPDRAMAHQRSFDLCRVDVVTPRLEDIVHTPQQPEVALCVEHSDIAGVPPTVG